MDSYLNLMGNKLKPKEVNDALNSIENAPTPEPTPTPTVDGKVKKVTWTGDGNVPNVRALPEDVGIVLDIEQDNIGNGYTVAPFVLKSSGAITLINRSTNTIGSIEYTFSNGSISLGTGAVGVDDVFNRGQIAYTLYYLPIETE